MMAKSDKREYNLFRKQLKRNGYVTIQESVLIKLLNNSSSAGREIKKLEAISPKKGAVYAIPICIADFKKLKSLSDVKFDFDFFTGNTIFI